MTTSEKLTRIADNMPKVYEAGKIEGITEGMQAEYDAFWDVYQDYGNRRVYTRAFSGYGFSFDNFHPKYDIRPTDAADHMFYAWDTRMPNQIGSLIAHLNECGVVLDTSKCTSLNQAFGYARFTEIPTVDFTALTKVNSQVFRDTRNLTKIEKIIVREDTSYSGWFMSDIALEEIRVEGTIGEDINFQDCPLSVESMISIITHLKPLDSENAYSRAVYFNQDCWARLEAAGIPTPLGYDTWKEQVQDGYYWNT